MLTAFAGVPFYPRGYPMEERWPKVKLHRIIILVMRVIDIDFCCFRLNPSFGPLPLPRALLSMRVCGWTILMWMPSLASATTSSLQSAMLALPLFSFRRLTRAHGSVKVHPRLLLCDGQRHVVPVQQPKYRAAPRPHPCLCAFPAHWPHGRHLGQVHLPVSSRCTA